MVAIFKWLPSGKLPFAVNYDHAYYFARIALRVDNAAMNAIKTLLNKIREKSEILRFLQNYAELLRFRCKCIGTKIKCFLFTRAFKEKKRKSNSDH